MSTADPFRKARKRCVWCNARVHTAVKVQRPMCHGCRAKRRNLAKSPFRKEAAVIVTVLFNDKEHAALLRYLHEQGVHQIAESGPALDRFDLRGAVLAMERAANGRPLRSA